MALLDNEPAFSAVARKVPVSIRPGKLSVPPTALSKVRGSQQHLLGGLCGERGK